MQGPTFTSISNINSHTMKRHLLFIWIFTLFSTIPLFALHFESGENVRISRAIYEDVYVFGGTIYIDAPVYGDIWCAGGTVTISDTVSGDLVVAGGNINLRGVVLDDVRAAGGDLGITGRIGGDLLVTGGTVLLESEAVVDGSFYSSGGNITLNGHVRQKFKAAAGTTVLNGTIDNGVEINCGNVHLNGTIGGTSVLVAGRITVGDDAVLRGNVRYWTNRGETDFGSALQGGAQAQFDPDLRHRFERPDYKFLGFASFLAVIWYLASSFILILIGQWLFAGLFRRAAQKAGDEPIRSLGFGFLYFAVVPIAAVLMLVTIVGIPVGFIVLFFYLLFLLLASVITALTGAFWLDQRNNHDWRPIQIAFVALGVLVALKLVGFIPFIGWIAKVAAVFTAFGAIINSNRFLNRAQTTA